MTERLRRAVRMVKVQARKRDLAEWRLAGIGRAIADLERARDGVLAALDSNLGLHGLFVQLMAPRVRSIDREVERLRRAQEQQATRVASEKRRARLAEIVHLGVVNEERRQAEKAELLDLVEAAMARDAAQGSEKLRAG